MTYYEKKQPPFTINDEVCIMDTQIYQKPKWIIGIVEEVGDETILVKWADLKEPTEYELSDLPDIKFLDNNMRTILISQAVSEGLNADWEEKVSPAE